MIANSTAAHLADAIRSDINRGRWRDGDTLRQEELAAQFSVSRIPVREALALLQSEGLVAIQTHRGARVVQLSPADVGEIFDLRVLLETRALRLAVPGHTRRSLGRLKHLQDDLEHEETPAGWINGDRAFHEALYEPCARPRLLGLIRQQRLPIERYGLAVLSPGSRRVEWSVEHGALLDAVAAGDADRASACLETHLRETERAIIAALPNP